MNSKFENLPLRSGVGIVVLNKDNKAIIIDYKSGAPNNYHKKQLNSYEKALKNMGYDTLKKLLLYMEEDAIKVENC